MAKPRFNVGDEVRCNLTHMEHRHVHTVIAVYKNIDDNEEFLYDLSAYGCSSGCLAREDDLTKIERKAS